jgi:ribosomal protein S18 acetylase RimI-like enzyme
MLTIKRVSTIAELAGIQKLQQINLKKNLEPAEAETEGFVLAEYTLAFLETMHRASPSVIAKNGEEVVGYALVALPAIRHQHDLLGDLFNTIDKTTYRHKLLKDAKYVVVGQLCVAKQFRGMGLVQQLYQFFKQVLEKDFDYCITDVAQDNPRSLKAHTKSGFQVVNTLVYGGVSWDIVLWDWTI